MTDYTARCYTDHSDTVTAAHDGRAVWLAPSSGGASVGLGPDSARTLARGILALADEIDGGEAKPASSAEPRRVRVGDRLRVTETGLNDAKVSAGDVVTIEYVYSDGESFETSGDGWVFDAPHIGNGLEFIDEPLKVGDRVVVVRDDKNTCAGEFVGKVGTLRGVDLADDGLPYLVEFAPGAAPHMSWYCAEVRRVSDTPTVTALAEEPALKVGDRVMVVRNAFDYEGLDNVGRVGELRQIDEDYQPYFVVFDDGDDWWCAEVHRVNGELSTDTTSSVADPRRLAALKEAQEITSDSETELDTLAVARFLLGE